MKQEFLVTVEVGSIELIVEAKDKKEAIKKALKEIEDDLNYFYELDFFVEEENAQSYQLLTRSVERA